VQFSGLISLKFISATVRQTVKCHNLTQVKAKATNDHINLNFS